MMITTEIIILLILVLLIGLITYFGFKLINKNKNQNNFDTVPLKDTLTRIESDLKTNFSGLNQDQRDAIGKWSEALTKLGTNDSNINDLKQRLDNLITNSNTKFDDVNKHQTTSQEKLNATISELQKNLETINSLKTDVQSLNNIFYNSKTRGNLGEFSLNSILTNILGQNSKIWTTQSKMNVEDNKSQSGYVDAIINMGEKEKIAIDAKFPLDRYLAIEKGINEKIAPEVLKLNQDKFKTSVKDKIKEVKKYINLKNKITHAILFVPSEAIFNYLNSEMPEVFETSFQERIWICSPTTLAALLHIIFQIQKDHELNKNIIKVKTEHL